MNQSKRRIKSLFLTENVGDPSNICTGKLIAESCNRYETFSFEPEFLAYKNGKLVASCRKVSLNNGGDSTPEASEDREEIIFDKNILCTIRLNPPFDSRYLTIMQLLEFYGNGAKIYNKPASIVAQPEKIIPSFLQNFTPKTIITANFDEIKKFWKEQKDIIVKPLYDYGGHGIFRVSEYDENHKSIFEMLQSRYNEPIIAQEYLPAVKQGDKRIMLLDGEYLSGFNRVPPQGQLQAAIHAGGTYEKTAPNGVETEICELLKPYLKEKNILLCGLDIIGDKLTEINVTCPSGFTMVNKIYNHNFVLDYWDKVAEKLA